MYAEANLEATERNDDIYLLQKFQCIQYLSIHSHFETSCAIFKFCTIHKFPAIYLLKGGRNYSVDLKKVLSDGSCSTPSSKSLEGH